MLHDDYDITRSPRSFNSQIGVPFSVWEMDSNTQIGIFEAGISQMNEMEKLENIIKPEIGIFTNLGDAHQEHFASLKAKCSEKLKLFKGCKTVIYNKDDKLIDICMQQARLKANLLTFGKSNEADIHIEDIQKDGQKTTICYTYKGKRIATRFHSSTMPRFENSLQCLATLLLLGVKNSTIRQRMENLESVAMRLEVKEGQKGCIVINDSYNSDINSLSIALDFMTQQAEAKNTKRTLILSDIMQSGQKTGKSVSKRKSQI